MPELIEGPSRITAAGEPPKLIDEYVGAVNTRESRLSVAHMRSPAGWAEPGQRPEFDEFTVVLRGTLTVEHEDGVLEVAAGQAVHTRPGRVGPLQLSRPGGRRVHRGVPARVRAVHGAPGLLSPARRCLTPDAGWDFLAFMISRSLRRKSGRPAVALALAALGAAALPAGPAAAGAQGPRIDQLQFLGSHNSYHREPSAAEYRLMSITGTRAEALQYSHVPLGRQFAKQNVRQIELDLFADPHGGRYARPPIRALTGQRPAYDRRMNEPGTKVLHIAGLDYRSNCLTLTDCLENVATWSRDNPGHVPVTILLEFKEPFDPLHGWTRQRLLGVEREIRSVFDANDLITPDTVRRPGRTLEQSVLGGGWPTLRAARGKVMFLMDNTGEHRDRYVQGNPSLQGRVMFTASEPGRPDAAFVKRNDPAASDIRSLVTRGYMVRTRADADTVQARNGDTRMRDTALASGAQWVSTDYPVPGLSARFGTRYFAALPGLVPVRCNPVNAPDGCAVTDRRAG
ncbi:Ca2+-dependent phosphoinositide-specific phospholipase C [Thermomonospora umbrina]|uniref:Calcium-dependent phosphoinositide phospholipase C n=1 Tax=Thermomonospora umbrina TaxID=111806 RepID=A0A3D9SJ22_9ACTN|nr:Ca2+-dependent phosphoinositide-specific phospholipase C [Thermomonospora umbrina]REE95697.1 calcium-dependent phosphoinositide phospholipase C [Thermomonospora umbrina]